MGYLRIEITKQRLQGLLNQLNSTEGDKISIPYPKHIGYTKKIILK